MEKLMTAKQVAEVLGIKISTLYGWNSEGRIPVVSYGKSRVMYRPQDVKEFIDNHLTPRNEVHNNRRGGARATG